MSVTVDVRQEGGATGSAGATSLAWNHTVSAGLANGMLVGCGNVASASNTTISTFQWDAAGTPVNLTILGRVNDSLAVTWASLWGLVNPSSGTKQLKITPAASAQIVAGSASYSGVNQSAPWNAASPQSAIGTAGAGTNQPTVNVTSAVGDIAVVMAADNEQANNDLLVMGSGQTVICNDQIGAGQMSSAASDKAGASSVTMSYSGVSSTYTWAIIGGSLNSAPSGTPYLRAVPYALDIVRNPLARAVRTMMAYSTVLPTAPIVTVILQRRTVHDFGTHAGGRTTRMDS